MKRISLLILLLIAGFALRAQQSDSLIIRGFFNEALSSNIAYKNLEYLCTKIGGRICCSPQAAAAVEWSKQLMESMGLDTVYLQKCKVRCWKRGEPEMASVTSSIMGTFQPPSCALGGSVGTGKEGLIGKIVEVKSLDELKKLGKAKLTGKIVFFNRPADPTCLNTFQAYGGAADQRVNGAIEAARNGAAGVVIRSLTVSYDHNPHTGNMHYNDSIKKIPAIAIGTIDADQLSDWLKKDPELNFYFRTTCYENPDDDSYNVIGELKGSEHPDKIICFGGHLDAWDIGQGAQDDGGGAIQNVEAIRLFKDLGIKHSNTLRVVLFMDEELGQRGARKYAEEVSRKNEKIVAAIESDEGVFTPDGFAVDASEQVMKKLDTWRPLFLQYGLYNIAHGYSGVDVGMLKPLNIPLFELMTDSQRYFDSHHALDKFEAVNKREMQLGSASIAMLIYLIDKYGLE